MPTASLSLVSVKRAHGLATLTLSNGEILSIPRAMLKERPYRAGMPFDVEAFHIFIRERSYSFALEKAVSLLAVRTRTEKEIYDALKRNAYPETAIARVMAYLHESGYLNDADFAGHWAQSRTQKGMGPRRIRMELRQKGIDSDTIEDTLSALSEDEQLTGVRKAAERFSRGRDLTLPSDRQKVIAALARRGYDFSLARQAIELLVEDESVSS